MNCALTSVVHEYLSVISVKGYARPKDSKVIRDIKENFVIYSSRGSNKYGREAPGDSAGG